jgi:acyl-CoA thioesterase
VSRFGDETAVVADGDGRWRCRLDPAWNIGATPNGGYALTPVVRAMRELAGQPDPLAVSAHYVRPSLAGADAVVEARLVRTGRTTATVAASLLQEGTERIVVTATFGDLATGASEPSIPLPPPDDLPPPEACTPRGQLPQGVELPIASRLEVRIHPDDTEGTARAEARVRGWIRFLDGTPVDVVALPLFADAFPPALFTTLGRVGWLPTVELAVHVRRRPAPGWVRADFTCDDLAGGRMVETGTLWDEGGAVVARSRQLGLLLER